MAPLLQLDRGGRGALWSLRERSLGSILSLGDARDDRPLVAETYPRYVIRRLWNPKPPSKRKEPLRYVDEIWSSLKADGYSCPGVCRPVVDQVDAMLCAIAAASCLDGRYPPGARGAQVEADADERVLREGFIVSP